MTDEIAINLTKLRSSIPAVISHLRQESLQRRAAYTRTMESSKTSSGGEHKPKKQWGAPTVSATDLFAKVTSFVIKCPALPESLQPS